MAISLSTPVMYLKGVGPQRSQKLAERGIHTVEDLLAWLPFRYEDRLHFTAIKNLELEKVSTVRATVYQGALVGFRYRQDAMYHLTVHDPTGLLYAVFFHGKFLEKRFKPGQSIVLHGKVELDRFRPGRLQMLNPEYEILNENASAGAPGASRAAANDSTEVGRIVPIYEALGDISSKMLRRIIYFLLGNLEHVPDALPPAIRERHQYPSRREALNFVHFPPHEENLERLNNFRSAAHQRLIFEEFFFYQLGLAARHREIGQRRGWPMRVREDPVRDALKRILPFKPTGAQKRVLREIVADLERPAPMNRLLEGDVGSGKTLVALEAATIVIENGYQAALMAPTEILAVQHYLSARRILAPARYGVALLLSGLKKKEKTTALEQVRSGEAQFVVGTHALIEDAVAFAKLGLVIVDEQHRFGVMQRKRLMEKGASPHVLVMTATPIPRSLALTLYGDLDLSVIDEMPPGRTPMTTRWITQAKLAGEWEFVRREVAKGRQAYVIYPVIEESKLELKAATEEYERLAATVFTGLQVGLLHGRLRSEEKDDVMERFRAGAIQILVATTVVEVGVDVPNATVMVIEHAERFGLAQLHQLRGRIGRGREKSCCVLVDSGKVSEEGRQRLETMVATTDGFKIAEKDLQLRGPGEFFGTRQHGDLTFTVAHPLRDHELLELARQETLALSEDPARAAELRGIVANLGAAWEKRYHLAIVG
jgi:ATP-dependent DNA helicase RecG